MIPARFAKILFAGILVITLFGSTLAGLWRPAHAEINHGSMVSQSCLVGCMNTATGVQIGTYLLHSQEEQARKPITTNEPHYVQFLRFYEPRKITALSAYGAAVLRPPDLILLNSNYRF